MSSKPLVELRHITKSYGGVHAVSDVSFPIGAASVHALVGENGAGKSTLVKIFAGVHPADSGRLLVNGVEVLPEDVAEAIAFFAGPRSAKSTGNILNVDGGVTAAYPR